MAQSEPCAMCGGSGSVELQMTVASGSVLTMISCNRCEARTWLADGEPVAIADVLKITADDPDFVVTPAARKTKAAGKR